MDPMTAAAGSRTPTAPDGIPFPIVTFNRWVLVSGLLGAYLLRVPAMTTVLFVILLAAVLFGSRYSLIFQVGRRLFASRLAAAEREDRRLMRFNNSIAAIVLGLAQIAFLAGVPAAGWTFALIVVVAAAVALAGFCAGCFLYYQFRLQKSRLFSRS
jgi:hypothetical protein